MELNVWNKPSGYSFGVFQERSNLNIPLPVDPLFDVTYSVISGKLPNGVRLVNGTIIGSPDEVLAETVYSFCIRARRNDDLADRTFTITIQGEDVPVFLTPAGPLAVGDNNQYFIIDNSVVDYQISAVDSDTVAGVKLSYFISSKDGELPPGLKLTTDGRIFGRVQGVTEIRLDDGNGKYDNGVYDRPYDFAYYQYTTDYRDYINKGGYEYYPYDIIYDYEPDPVPLKTLNRTYEFYVTVSNGIRLYDRRRFQIYVIGDTFFRADTTALISQSGMFTADASYLRNPIWLTPSDLGMYRANNYITLVLDVYDIGQVFYKFETTTTKWKPLHSYKLNDLIYVNSKLSYICIKNHTSESTFTTNNWHPYGLPAGMKFDPQTSEVFGYVRYQSEALKIYKFRITAYRYGDTLTDIASSSQTFTINIISEINSVLTWNTKSDLGYINAGYKSTLAVNASSTILNSQVTYNITSGKLPPGLDMSITGEISGIVNQYTTSLSFDCDDVTFDYNRTSFRQRADQGLISFDFNPTIETTFDDLTTTISDTTFNKHKKIDIGILSFDYDLETGTETTFSADGYMLFRDTLINALDTETTLDNDTTTIDYTFTFNVLATDQYIYSAIENVFTVEVNTLNTLTYSNVYVKPFLTLSQREMWSSFINNPGIFTLENLYRPADSNFGVQTNLEMLIYAGLETSNASVIARAIEHNFKKKQFRFNGIYKAIAMPIGTSTVEYEVVYITMIDPLEINNNHVSSTITTNNAEVFPSSVSLWRERISTISSTKGNFLPLWMRSIQPGTRAELGYVLAIPLCFCKVGKADDIILNIKYSNFDFKSINYTIDRIILDSVTGYNDDKYIIFNNNRETI
jgi:ribosomal protein L23